MAMNDVDFPVAARARRHRRAAERRARADQGQHGRQARRERAAASSTWRAHFRGTGHILRFIEYMDVGTPTAGAWTTSCPAAEIVATIDAALPLSRSSRTTRAKSPTAGATATAAGEIGVIASVTQPFCGACTRARLSAEGKLYTCLFARRGPRPARAAARRRERRGDRRAPARGSGGRRARPLLRAAHREPRRPGRRSRCRTSAARDGCERGLWVVRGVQPAMSSGRRDGAATDRGRGATDAPVRCLPGTAAHRAALRKRRRAVVLTLVLAATNTRA